jgi:uncharacterized protein (TIGR00369 family)
MEPRTDESRAQRIDAEAFFSAGGFHEKYPGVKVPPPCFVASGAEIVAHEPGKSLTVAFPVREEQANPVGFLQGGYVCAMFDNVFGPLAFATTHKPCLSVDINVNFVRGLKPGETATVRAEFLSKTKKLLQLRAEAFNEQGKLAATATSNMMVYEP